MIRLFAPEDPVRRVLLRALLALALAPAVEGRASATPLPHSCAASPAPIEERAARLKNVLRLATATLASLPGRSWSVIIVADSGTIGVRN